MGPVDQVVAAPYMLQGKAVKSSYVSERGGRGLGGGDLPEVAVSEVSVSMQTVGALAVLLSRAEAWQVQCRFGGGARRGGWGGAGGRG